MIELTADGFIQVTRDGLLISQHRLEREAIESCAKRGPGRYVLHYPTVRLEVIGDEVTLETGEISGVMRV
jgi:hypothetical protein